MLCGLVNAWRSVVLIRQNSRRQVAATCAVKALQEEDKEMERRRLRLQCETAMLTVSYQLVFSHLMWRSILSRTIYSPVCGQVMAVDSTYID